MTKKLSNTNNRKVSLGHVLVLNSYILNMFGLKSLEGFGDEIKDSRIEGYDTNNISNYYHYLITRLFSSSILTADQLLYYDQNIYSHTRSISSKRDDVITWKYFQYLALLFTEIYLDRFFSNKELLLHSLNEYCEKFNAGLDKEGNAFKVEAFTETDLNKLAFWNATGSGKTLLMHINICQYRYYLIKSGKEKGLNRVILLTPNEGLSNQHLLEFEISGLEAELFSKEGKSLFAGNRIEIIDIHKLEETQGNKTVAVDSFEGNNLVLVDEGHRGASGDDWKDKRDRICESGFSFEYSATFGQAISAASGSKRNELLQEYAKCTLFDYSYRYFHADGYGKDFQILNLNETWNDETTNLYLTACLLSYYQQLSIFNDDKTGIPVFLIEKPLLVFVGSKVTAVRKENNKEVSDVVQILQYFESFINNESRSVDYINRFLNGTDGLNDKNNHPIFNNAFIYLIKKRVSATEVFREVLLKVFNSSITGALLHLDNLKGAEGEIGLRVGDADYFGVINVGDDRKLLKLCEQVGISTADRDFSSSLFYSINTKDSGLNVLIGSKKFTEGWSSWRVSTMGLMNIGRGEGSEIIQLFGRGVRLKGYNFSLKRSDCLDSTLKPMNIPQFIKFIETLNVFGIRADYMQQFKEYLEEEGLSVIGNGEEFIQIDVPTILPTIDLTGKKLKVLRIKDGIDFKTQIVKLPADTSSKPIHIKLDWYPKLQVLKSANSRPISNIENLEQGILCDEHLAFINWNDAFFEIQKFKNERNWHNLSVTKKDIEYLFKNDSWYTLYIPSEDLKFKSFNQIRIWQEIVVVLCKGYIDRYYNFEKNTYLGQYIESEVLDITHPNFIEKYSFFIKQSEETIIEKIKELKRLIETTEFKQSFSFGANSEVFEFSQHLYKPIVYFSDSYSETVRVMPVQLNEGEKYFIKHLQIFHETKTNYFTNKEFYLLRNLSKKGIGFFEANGFYPDFLMWLVNGQKQYLTFIDPKGLRQIEGFDHPKIQFHKKIKEDIQQQLKDESLILNSFIISTTPFAELRHWKGQNNIGDFNKQHVFFQPDQKEAYIGIILEKIVL